MGVGCICCCGASGGVLSGFYFGGMISYREILFSYTVFE